MPIKNSAKKYMRVTAKKTANNNKTRGAYRAAVRNLEKAIQANDSKAMTTYFALSQKTLDKAVQKNILSKNAAARKKSRLSKKIVATKVSH